MDEKNGAEILAHLASELIERKPLDPLDHLIRCLSFPFATQSSFNIQDPSLCQSCSAKSPESNWSSVFFDQSKKPCCVYELRGPFSERGDEMIRVLTNFFNSRESIIVIVGDSEHEAENDHGCSCFGSGKTRLCRWLDFPGRFIHRRRVLRMHAGNVGSLIEFLESIDETAGSGFLNKLSELSAISPQQEKCLVEPTLSLIDGVEPPHYILHALLQHNYFRSERTMSCMACASPSAIALHKTILFSRSGVFFKFPLPCPIFTMKRVPFAKQHTVPSAQQTSVSFTAMVGPAQGKQPSRNAKKPRVTFGDVEEEKIQSSPLVVANEPTEVDHFREHDSLGSDIRMMEVLKEISAAFQARRSTSRAVFTTVDQSETFSHSVQSRCRGEYLLAQTMIERNIAPTFDLSEFPELVNFLVQMPKVDVYFAKQLGTLHKMMRSRVAIDRLLVGNLLCLTTASQQTLSIFPLPVTATDMLQLYIDTFVWKPLTPMSSHGSLTKLKTGSSSFGSEEAAPVAAPGTPHCREPQTDIVATLNLQNLLIENVDYNPSKSAPLIAQNLLDVRGAVVAHDLLNFLLRGTSTQSYRKSCASSPNGKSTPSESTPTETSSEYAGSKFESDSSHRQYGHPVLLLSDVTDVARRGYEGHGVAPAQRSKNVGVNIIDCFIVKLGEDGINLVITIEKYRVVARLTFAAADSDEEGDDGKVYWQLSFMPSRSVVRAQLLSDSVAARTVSKEAEKDSIAMLLIDGSICCVNVNDVPRGALITVEASSDPSHVDDDVKVRFVPSRPPASFSTPKRPCQTLGESQTPLADLLHEVVSPTDKPRSFVRRDSRVTVDMKTPSYNSNDRASSCFVDDDADLEFYCDRCVAIIDHKTLVCDDPFAFCMSMSWTAAANADSDIVCAVPNPLVVVTKTQPLPSVIMQAESNISSLAIVDDNFVVIGLENGKVQCFKLPLGSECFVIDHHEAKINVIKNLSPPSADKADDEEHYFIVGSEDSTLTMFCLESESLVRTIPFHNAPVVDVAFADFFSNNIIVSADRSGAVIVSRTSIETLQEARVLWTSTFLGLRSLHLSRDSSWLVCSRHQNSPIAVPIAEWVRQGAGQFHQKPISSLHIPNDEKTLLTGGEDGLIFVWDLNDSLRFVRSFQQHSRSSTISSITTSSNSKKVVSSDTSKFIYVWELETGAMIRLLDRGTGGFARFIHNDFILVQSGRGIRVFDEEYKLFISTGQGTKGCIDVFFAPDDLFDLCFRQNDQASQKQRSTKTGFSSSSSSSSSSSGSASERDSDSEEATQASQQNALSMSQSMNEMHERMRRQCFLGVSRANPHADTYSVGIFTLSDLNNTCFELIRGDVEDEFGDEEEVCHSDNISAFSFLPPRSPYVKSNDPNEAPPPPSVLLAATGAEDLTVILWHWRKQSPLIVLRLTHFVTRCVFWCPSLGRRQNYSSDELNVVSRRDPAVEHHHDGSLVCNLLVSQYADDSKNTLRVFQIRENSRAFQKRLLANRCNQPTTAATFPYNMLQVNELNTSCTPAGSNGSVKCIAVRASDGLVCTGHDETCEVMFWRLLAERPSILQARPPPRPQTQTSPRNGDSDDSDEDERPQAHGPLKLRPLRRIVSRI